MDSIWSEQQNEPFFLPNSLSTVDPFDMESFNPFDDATFSMPEGSVPAILNSSAYAVQSPFTDFTLDPISSPSQRTPSSSPQSLQSALDLEFPVEVISSSNSPQNSPVDDWLFNPATGEVSLSQDSREASKRSKNNGEGDLKAACWTSPLCPNKKEDGGRPDSCKGECADFLFAHPTELPDDKKFLSEIMAKSEPKVTLETPHRGVKRQEMESSPEYLPQPRATSSSDLVDTPKSVAEASPISSTTKPSTRDNSNPRSSPETTQPISRTAKPKGRVPHNQVEKKYRENVNAQLEALRRVVPVSRQQLSGFDGFDMEDLGAGSRQPSKAVVLSSATAYIKQLERESERMVEEIASLKAQNKTLQSLVKCDDCSLMNYMKRWKIQTGA
jgi:Helix-loop-helix DNA-binding domain